MITKIFSIGIICLVAIFFQSCNKGNERAALNIFKESWEICLDNVDVIVEDYNKKVYIKNFPCHLMSYSPGTRSVEFGCKCGGDESRICKGITSKLFDAMRGKNGQYLLVISDDEPVLDKYGKVVRENTKRTVYLDADELNKFNDVNYWIRSYDIDGDCLIGWWFWFRDGQLIN